MVSPVPVPEDGWASTAERRSAPGGAALVTVIFALQLQVRSVEEPHPMRTHGRRCRDYAARAGRFVPGIGTLPGSRRPSE